MNITKIARFVPVAVFGLLLALTAMAQPIGVLQSAETMDRGAFKVMAAPIMVFGKNGADNEFGLTARLGYAFTDRFDVEAKLGFFSNGTLIGVDGEYWIYGGSDENTSVDFSLAGGLHWTFGSDNYYDIMGIEVIPQVSGNLSENLELCAAGIISLEYIQDIPAGYEVLSRQCISLPESNIACPMH